MTASQEPLRIFFTGASSFTGFWFAQTLVRAGHRVTCLFTQQNLDGYSAIRKQRVKLLVGEAGIRPIWSAPLASAQIPDVLEAYGPWDVFCHHAADVRNYKSPDFDPLIAAANAVEGLDRALGAFRKHGGQSLICSGTYFESGQGTEGKSAPAFSPYAVSKTLANELARFYAHRRGITVTKFIMANPFGPYEERGFTTYLAKSWLNGEVPRVETPNYLRDNVPVTVMAEQYAQAVDTSLHAPTYRETAPSGYTGSQGEFALEFATNLRPFLGSCPLRMAAQEAFFEPYSRMNSAQGKRPDWTHAAKARFWRELSDFYLSYIKEDT
jgi:nucleoside-diphosphate-sugar epimerase